MGSGGRDRLRHAQSETASARSLAGGEAGDEGEVDDEGDQLESKHLALQSELKHLRQEAKVKYRAEIAAKRERNERKSEKNELLEQKTQKWKSALSQDNLSPQVLMGLFRPKKRTKTSEHVSDNSHSHSSR